MTNAADHSRPNLRQSRHQRVYGGARLEEYGDRRRCHVDGCDTLLSRYNPSSVCTVHAGWQDTRQRSHA